MLILLMTSRVYCSKRRDQTTKDILHMVVPVGLLFIFIFIVTLLLIWVLPLRGTFLESCENNMIVIIYTGFGKILSILMIFPESCV